MAHDLLSTKLRIPPRSQHVVRRARLVDTLEDGIPRHKLTLVSAPAGYGKTTLLADWARTSRYPIAWLSLGEEDSDVERFFRYLLTAWEGAQPGVGDSPLGMLLGAMMPDRDAVLTAFINVASDLPEQTVFVLDDYHLIDDSSIHTSLTFLLDHLPTTIHFVLAGRGEPPLPLARYRARRELLEFDASDLQFQVEETNTFLNREMGLNLAGDTIASLHAQLEGWIAGTQMVALTLRRQQRPAGEIVISGRHRFIADYLSQDVLAHLPDDLRRFLLRTSILDRLSGPLCDAVIGGDDARSTLEMLKRDNLFLIPLDDNRDWYRYHRLFADFLRDEIQWRYPEEIANLHRQAAGWYLAHDLPEPAFGHGLAAQDLDLVVQIVDRYDSAMLHGGELSVLKGWLDAIPEAWYAAYPLLGLTKAGLLAFTGALDACVDSIDDVELKLSGAGATSWQYARVTAYRCFVACITNDLAQAEALADKALGALRGEDLSIRLDVHHALGDTYRRNGRWEDAKIAYRRVLELAHPPVGLLQSAHVYGALADLELRQGRLQDAAGYWRKALAAIQEPENWGRLPLPVIGWVYVRAGELLYEWNDLAGAWDHVSRGLARAELGGDVRTMIAGYLLAGRITLTEGDTAAASQYLERARPLSQDAPFPEWTSRFERLQLELWLARDQLRAAVDWSDAILSDDSLHERPEPASIQLATARVLIFKGDTTAVDRALALLATLLRDATTGGRVGVQLEALALRALADWRRGDRAGAMTALEHALRLAEPEGYQRTFADLGLPMTRLLQEARSRRIMPDYVATLLAACGTLAIGESAASEPALSEPLSNREQEILELIAAGLTNPEIADRLFISPETVKRHASNIYSKLGVRSRIEAVARARDQRVLG